MCGLGQWTHGRGHRGTKLCLSWLLREDEELRILVLSTIRYCTAALWTRSGTNICPVNCCGDAAVRPVQRWTHSLKRRLWILVMALEAMGLPMPELAGEPWDTGVMLYGEF